MIISRQEARAAGLTRYFSGKACPKGHVSERMASNTDCVACMRERQHRHYRQNGDEVRAASRARYAVLYEAGPERFRERSRRNYWANPEEWKARMRAYVAANPEKVRAAHALYRTKGVPGTFSEADIVEKFAQQECRCVCGADLRDAWQIDHVIPLSRGGTNWPDNIQLLCPPCNQSKRDKTMEEWAGRAA